jgi:dTDP-glucose 4,6-dehydratase
VNLVVTGGRGFIGSHFIEHALRNGCTVVDIDKMTYASSDVLPFDADPNYSLIKKDICDVTHIPPCDALINFAAESHVDNSIAGPTIFFNSNTSGVFNLLELVRGKVYNRPLFFHISTDEVYGDIRGADSLETDVLSPGNPYSASKAAAEMFVLSYNKTYDVDFIITRSSNNYGPRQYPEKLIPQIIYCLNNNKKIPIHGDGSYLRDWIEVGENVKAIYHLLTTGERNEVYNISSNNHLTNLQVVQQVCQWYDIENYMDHIQFVPNRLGQDTRYSICSDKLKSTGYKIESAAGLKNLYDQSF